MELGFQAVKNSLMNGHTAFLKCLWTCQHRLEGPAKYCKSSFLEAEGSWEPSSDRGLVPCRFLGETRTPSFTARSCGCSPDILIFGVFWELNFLKTHSHHLLGGEIALQPGFLLFFSLSPWTALAGEHSCKTQKNKPRAEAGCLGDVGKSRPLWTSVPG